ncbi:hypothetical protein D3C87_1270860 [compost metagenome]
MKEINNITIYKCDFCAKELKRKYAMINHELICNDNPENKKACHFCTHLEQVDKEVYFENPYYNPDYNDDDGKYETVKVFRCKKLDKFMFPYSIEKRGLSNKYPSTFDEQEPMPSKCDSFDDEYNF